MDPGSRWALAMARAQGGPALGGAASESSESGPGFANPGAKRRNPRRRSVCSVSSGASGMSEGWHRIVLPATDYDLSATLDSGQAFRWAPAGSGWEGVVAGRWVRLEREPGGIGAATLVDPGDWGWLHHYLAVDEEWEVVAATFPPDPQLREAVAACRGLRLLRQDPWECLASFIL